MNFGANINVDNRNIDVNFKVSKAPGEADFFGGLFGDSTLNAIDTIEDIIDDEDEAFGDEDDD